MQPHQFGQQLHFYCRNVIMIYVGLVVIVGLIGIWSVLPARNKITGLEGTWSSATNAGYSYEFRSNGLIEVMYHGSTVKIFLSWERIGDKITVTTKAHAQSPIEEWTFTGRFQGKVISGIATLRTPDDTHLLAYDEVWVRDQANSTLGIISGSSRQNLAIA